MLAMMRLSEYCHTSAPIVGGDQLKLKGILFLILILITVPALPAAAVDWKFYGSARFRTWYYDHTYEEPSESTSYRSIWGLQGNSRIGATINSGDLGGRFEYGGSSELRLRRLYGTWNFGKGVFLVGKEYTPLDFTISSQVVLQDLALNGWGTLFSRKPMLQVSMFGWDIALVEPSTSDLEGRYLDDPNGASKAENTSVLFPSFETKYTYTANKLKMKAIAGFSTYEIADVDNNKDDVHRWIIGFSAGYEVGSTYLAVQFHYGQNLGTWRIAADWAGSPNEGFSPASSADPLVVNGEVKDNLGYGAAIECRYTLNDRITFAAGLGGIDYTVDISGATSDTALAVYFNSDLKFAGNALLVPEVGYFDGKQDGFGDTQNQSLYVGAKWQISF
jgi:hypothetical protein